MFLAYLHPQKNFVKSSQKQWRWKKKLRKSLNWSYVNYPLVAYFLISKSTMNTKMRRIQHWLILVSLKMRKLPQAFLQNDDFLLQLLRGWIFHKARPSEHQNSHEQERTLSKSKKKIVHVVQPFGSHNYHPYYNRYSNIPHACHFTVLLPINNLVVLKEILMTFITLLFIRHVLFWGYNYQSNPEKHLFAY